MNRRDFALGASAFALAACGPKERAAPAVKAAPPAPAPVGSLAWAVRGGWRLEPERDRFRHPVETLTFFGIQPNMTVVEIFPGRGWYTAILAPYLARGGGKLFCASFDPLTASDAQVAVLEEFKDRFLKDKGRYGDIQLTVLSDKIGAIAPPGSADMVLVMRNVHTFMAEGYAERAFADIFTALKPGGVLGVEEHRAKSTGLQDPQAGDGYVQEAYVKLLAKEAGFEFVGSSEVNANPKDTKDHPFGVWTLPPVLRTAELGMPPNKSFDSSKYITIGESDRMTLKFRKPPEGPPAEPLRGSMSPDR
jgi:predicted methyltransferase